MTVEALQTTDAFVVTDLPEAASADGIVRCARKVLVDSTRSLARSRTYAWAALGQKISGASAGINIVGDGRDAALKAFVSEITPRASSGALTLAAGKGVADDELAELPNHVRADHESLVAGFIACANALDDLGGQRVGIEFDGGTGDLLVDALHAAGAEVVATGSDAMHTPADVLLFGSRAGMLDHELAAEVPHRLLVPTANLAFTPRALAVAGRRDIVVVPDFLSTAGPLARRAGLDPGSKVTELLDEALGCSEVPVLGACLRAEEFLSTWVQEMPFGRPIG